MNVIERTISFFILGMGVHLSSLAVEGNLIARVDRTLIAGGDAWGGCMAALDTPISNATNTPDCPGPWITFSCTGTYAPKDRAFYMLDQAQLALALNKQVQVFVTDTQKHNDFCFAYRIDLLK